MLNAPKMSRRKVKAGSAHKTGGISREATVPVKPWTGCPKDITGLEPRQTLGPVVLGASGAMASGAKAPDAEKPEPRQWSRHVIKEVTSPTETADPPRDGEVRKMVSLTMDGRSKKALQTMEQDLSDAAKEVAGLPAELTGLF